MPRSTEAIDSDQVCSECGNDLGVELAQLSPCRHYVCFRCLSRLLAEKSPTEALSCPSCSEEVTHHIECRKDGDDSSVAIVLNHVKHSLPPQVVRSPDTGDDEASEGRRLSSSPRRIRRTKSKMRLMQSLNEDEQLSNQTPDEYNDDRSERADGKNRRDIVRRRPDRVATSKATGKGESQPDRNSDDDERLIRPRESGSTTSSAPRPPSSRPNLSSLRSSSSRRLSPDKTSQNRSQPKDSSDHVSDRKQPRRRSKSLSSSRHGQLRSKAITSSEHGGDGRRRRRTSNSEGSAHSTASRLSSKSNGAKQQRSRRGSSRQADPPAKARRDDGSSITSEPDKLDKVIDEGELTVSESDSNRVKESNAKSTTKLEPSESNLDPPEASAVSSDKGRKLVTQMKAIAKLAMLGRSLAQSPRKPSKSQRAMNLNSDNEDSERCLLG